MRSRLFHGNPIGLSLVYLKQIGGNEKKDTQSSNKKREPSLWFLEEFSRQVEFKICLTI